MALMTMIKSTAFVVKDWTVKHSPEILLTTSIVSGIGATVSGCIATKKMEAINERHKEALDILHNEHPGRDNGESNDENREYRRLVSREYGRYWFEVARTWAPCVGLTLASGTAALASFKIINGRLVMAETAFASVSKLFEQYRDNVIEDQGEEKDLYYINNGALKKKQELIEKGKYKEKKVEPVEEVKIAKTDEIFHYFFNEDSVDPSRYSHYPFYNSTFLSEAQTRFDHDLRTDGIVFLDDVYKYLGLNLQTLLAERAAGRTYGWVKDRYTEPGMPNDDRVMFGIYEYNDTQHRLFRAGEIQDVMLHFNCRLLTPETCTLYAKG